MAYKSFEELDVWKLGCRLAVRVYEVLKECRDFGLKDQMRRGRISRGTSDTGLHRLSNWYHKQRRTERIYGRTEENFFNAAGSH